MLWDNYIKENGFLQVGNVVIEIKNEKNVRVIQNWKREEVKK